MTGVTGVTGMLGDTFSRLVWSRNMVGVGVGANCFEDVWTVAWYSGTMSWLEDWMMFGDRKVGFESTAVGV